MGSAFDDTLLTTDGFPLAVRLFVPAADREPKAAVIIAGALGVPQSFYEPFAAWLADRGLAALTFDLRGMGASRPGQFSRSLRGFEADFVVWAQQDFGATVRFMKERFPTQPLWVVGHSLGAQHPGMVDASAQSMIEGLVAVASGAGYWKDWARPSRRFAPLLFYILGPWLTSLFGYFPGRQLKMVADLPQGAMRQWIRWCRHPDFSWGSAPDSIGAAYARARFPIAALSIADDESMTLQCTQKLLRAYSQAPSRLDVISPHELSISKVGHMGLFRKKFADSLWPLVLTPILASVIP